MANYVDEYQRKAHKYADYNIGWVPDVAEETEIGIGPIEDKYASAVRDCNKADYLYPALGLAEEAGEVAGKYAKAVRDCNGVIDEERKKEIVKELGDVCWFVAELATLLDVPLSDVMQGNLNKLESRRARGVIHGNGDNR